MRKAGATDYEVYSKKILSITKKPVSLEVFADDEKNMIIQGTKINSWSKNVYVKVPITNSKGKYMDRVIHNLNKKGIKLNITAVYKSKQTAKILKCINNKTPVIISIFVGRMADVGIDPVPEIKESLRISKKYKNVKILWASTREPYNYLQSKKLNCHLITVPPSIIDKIEKFNTAKNNLSATTVRGFLKDSKKSNFNIS